MSGISEQARAEAERRYDGDRINADDDWGISALERDAFTRGAKWAASLTPEPSADVREALRDTITGHPIGSGYYGTSVGTGEAREIADAILAGFNVTPKTTDRPDGGTR